MLLDPKFEKRMDELRLRGRVVEWSGSKPAGEEYEYESPQHCAAAQFNASIKRKYESQTFERKFKRGSFDDWLERLARARPRTFGALHARAVAAQGR